MNSSQVETRCANGQIHTRTQRYAVKTPTPTHRSITVPPPVLSPNITLPPTSSHCAYGKIWRAFN